MRKLILLILASAMVLSGCLGGSDTDLEEGDGSSSGSAGSEPGDGSGGSGSSSGGGGSNGGGNSGGGSGGGSGGEGGDDEEDDGEDEEEDEGTGVIQDGEESWSTSLTGCAYDTAGEHDLTVVDATNGTDSAWVDLDERAHGKKITAEFSSEEKELPFAIDGIVGVSPAGTQRSNGLEAPIDTVSDAEVSDFGVAFIAEGGEVIASMNAESAMLTDSVPDDEDVETMVFWSCKPNHESFSVEYVIRGS